MKINRIFVLFALLLGLCACANTETNYELAYLFLDREEGVNFFSQGDVNLVADNDFNMTNTGSSHVGFGVSPEHGRQDSQGRLDGHHRAHQPTGWLCRSPALGRRHLRILPLLRLHHRLRHECG